MSLIKVKVEWNGSNKVLNLDRSKANLYERLMMTLNMSIDEDIILFDGDKRVNDEVSLVASMEACVSKGLPHLQLTAKPDDGTGVQAELPPLTSTLQLKPKEPVANVKCTSCGHDMNGKKFCMNCGAKAPEPKPQQPAAQPQPAADKCVECGHALNGKKFCMNCGAKAPEAKPQQQAAPKQEAKPQPAADKCTECGHALNGKKFCMNCGAKAPEPKPQQPAAKPQPKQEDNTDKCVECGNKLNGKKFCMNCGAKAPEQKPQHQAAPKKEEPKQEDKCLECGSALNGKKFCMNCGAKAGEKKQEAPKQETKPKEIPKLMTKLGDENNCGRCGQPHGGNAVQALGRTWHPDCFTCVICSASFTKGGKTLMEKDGQPICYECYLEECAPKCDFCHKPLTENYAILGDKKIHPECFVCSCCGGQLQNKYFMKNGKIVCNNCK